MEKIEKQKFIIIMRIMKRLIFFIGMISFLRLNAQNALEINVDTVFCISINYFQNNNNEPELYTFLLPVHEKCHVNISNHDTFISSINTEAYPISDLYFSLFQMIKASFPDSSLSFQKEAFSSSFTKWIHYNLEATKSTEFYTKSNEFFTIAIAKVIAVTKHNVTGFPLALSIIKDIVPVLISDNCIRDDMMVISETFLYEM